MKNHLPAINNTLIQSLMQIVCQCSFRFSFTLWVVLWLLISGPGQLIYTACDVLKPINRPTCHTIMQCLNSTCTARYSIQSKHKHERHCLLKSFQWLMFFSSFHAIDLLVYFDRKHFNSAVFFHENSVAWKGLLQMCLFNCLASGIRQCSFLEIAHPNYFILHTDCSV